MEKKISEDYKIFLGNVCIFYLAVDGEVSLGGIGACNDSATTIDASYHRTLYPDK